MILALQLAAAALLLAPGDTTTAIRDSVGAAVGPRITGARAGLAAAADTTPRRRPRAVELSDAYALRLRIHRYASYATIPLFAAQTIAGNQMWQSGSDDPSWAKSMHVAGAAGLGALFTVNTVTGVWNLWESRGVSQGRTVKLVHSALMLASDAGFAYAGIKLGPEAHNSFSRRQEHRRVTYVSIGGALAGYATMLIANR